jgi:antitoxin HicB
MAKKIGTSRSQLDRLLDPTNVSVNLGTIVRAAAAAAAGKKLKVSFEDINEQEGLRAV